MSRELPLPIAVLARRARNAKSPKDRHDTAYYAWEASLRLAAACAARVDPGALARPSIGQWVSAARLDERPRNAPLLLAVYRLFADASPRSVTPRRLLDALPAYRNAVLGHGSTRAPGFYEDAGRALLEGLVAAWDEDVFLPRGSRLAFVESIEIDPGGARRARLIDLSSERPLVEEGAIVPDESRPHHVVLVAGSAHRSLHPWLVYDEGDLRERVLFFNALRRTAEYLDYASGELVKASALASRYPALAGEIERLFRREVSGAEPEAAPTPADDPSCFGGYRLLGKLGEGGMGVVYLARQESLGRLVALKMLPAALAGDATALARFAREVKALGRADHPHVIKVLASGSERGTPYYAMEYVEGADLAQVGAALSSADDVGEAVSSASEAVRTGHADLFRSVEELAPRPRPVPRRGGARFRDLALLFRDAARGLHHLHELGIVHRDVKPANLMVTTEDRRVVVMDLGLAALGDASRTITKDAGSILGTLRYMPPEQLQRSLLEVDRRADVYSLGATLYELATGRPLFAGESEARLIQQILREDPVPPRKASPRVPADLATVVTRATAKDPARRYPTAAALADDLDAFAEGRPIAARPPTLGYVLGLALRRHRAAALTASAALVLVAVLGGLFVWRLDSARREAEAERQRAEEVLDFMLRDLNEGLKSVNRLDLLDRVAEKAKGYYESLPAEGVAPATLARRGLTFQNLGSVYASQGRLTEALAAYRTAVEVAERLVATDGENQEWQADLATAHGLVGSVLDRKGDIPGALAEVERSIVLRRRLVERNGSVRARRDLAQSLIDRGGALLRLGRREEAEASARTALELRRQVAEAAPDAEFQDELATAHSVMSVYRRDAGDFAGQTAELRTALTILGQLVAKAPGDARLKQSLVNTHRSLGSALARLGERDSGLSEMRAATSIAAELVQEDPTNLDHQYQFARARVALGEALGHSGHDDPALSEIRNAVSIVEQLTRQSPQNSTYESSLSAYRWVLAQALVIRAQRSAPRRADLEEAVRVAGDAAKVMETRFGHNREDLAVTDRVAGAYSVRGEALLMLGRTADALAAEERALVLHESLLAADPRSSRWQIRLAWDLVLLGRCHAQLGDTDRARAAWTRAVEVNESVATDEDGPLDTQAQALLELGDVERARPLVEKLLARGWSAPSFLRLARRHGLAPSESGGQSAAESSP